MNPQNIILSSLSAGPATLHDIRIKNPDISLSNFQTAAWHLVHTEQIQLGKDWKLSVAA